MCERHGEGSRDSCVDEKARTDDGRRMLGLYIYTSVTNAFVTVNQWSETKCLCSGGLQATNSEN